MNTKTQLKNWDMLDPVDQYNLGDELQETMPIKKVDLRRKDFREFILEILKLREDEANRKANANELSSYDWITKEGQNKDI